MKHLFVLLIASSSMCLATGCDTLAGPKLIELKKFNDELKQQIINQQEDSKELSNYDKLRLSSADKYSEEELEEIANASYSSSMLQEKKKNPSNCITCKKTKDPNTWYQ